METKQPVSIKTDQKIVFESNVLEKIAGKTAAEVDGVLSLKGNVIEDLSNRLTDGEHPKTGVSVDLDDDQHTVDIELSALLAYGKDATEILAKVATKIAAAIKMMTGYQVKNIKLIVKDMLTPEEWQQRHENDAPAKTSQS
ncbi:Asp23/Gls24 family envelope stress response protein [Lactobacillus sp. CBA3605]|uniref:Asp23/Gls24 family envelope stress response protein n=1 Tax=Lactobacillus sp. CBA3605 TaxID=2099788 RepID=UPI000CFB0F7E|nr:Asp23/Gls24 family envelope stress response protein [Lactobacillus sp. CBA3605]AVK61082.1 Asp23/Gls24 family envelope stress response protein [Lactobacillus sp. CBA3605]